MAQYHTDLTEELVAGAKYAIIPGDPGRVPKIAAYYKNPQKIAEKREYVSYLGYLADEPVLAVSTGIGGPSASIAIEELAKVGVKTFIRIGTCGGMQMEIKPGDLVIVNGAIRMEGTSKEYLPIEFPAVPDYNVLSEIKAAADELGMPNHVGIVQCKDSFYGQHEPDSMPVGEELKYKWNAWIKGGALASEMESAALFTIASTRRLHAGALMSCVWNQERIKAGIQDPECHDTDAGVRVAVRAIERLILKEK